MTDAASARFNDFVQIVLEEEGALSNNSNDPGGLTKFGIAQKRHPDIDVANLTRDQAIEIYRTEYWQKVRADELPPPLDIAVADCAVNQGVAVAIETLQAVLKVSVDGELGPVTLAAAKSAPEPETTSDFFARRCIEYSHLPTFGTFGHGWYARCFRLAMKLCAPLIMLTAVTLSACASSEPLPDCAYAHSNQHALFCCPVDYHNWRCAFVHEVNPT